jgi:hypothetical protein
VGGAPENRHGAGYGKGKKGQHDKTPVAALVHKETGEVRTKVVANVNGADLRQVLASGR